MTDQWIIVPGWDRFQHYKDRTPTWIKLYTAELAHNPDFDRLSLAAKGLLMLIWIEQALSRGQASLKQIQSRAGTGYKHALLKSLCDAGFIEVAASKPLAHRYHIASPEKEVREDKTPPTPSSHLERSRVGGAKKKPGDYQRAENMVRNGGWQYEPTEFLDELEKFTLDPGQRHDLEQLRLTLLNGVAADDDLF